MFCQAIQYIFNKLSLSSPRAGLGVVVMKVVILKVQETLKPGWSGRGTFELGEVGNNCIESLVIVKVLKSISHRRAPKQGGQKRSQIWCQKWVPKVPQKCIPFGAPGSAENSVFPYVCSQNRGPKGPPFLLKNELKTGPEIHTIFGSKPGCLGIILKV